ncbi:hypothetical protein J5H79_13310, partial [Providencia rettgeri]|nr:hypothetical protein [Providencia rettgeri]
MPLFYKYASKDPKNSRSHTDADILYAVAFLSHQPCACPPQLGDDALQSSLLSEHCYAQQYRLSNACNSCSVIGS